MNNVAKRRTVGDIDSFILMMRAACEDRTMNDTLEKLLAMPDAQRRALVHNWVSDLILQKAPKDFIEAIACLEDDAIAEKAYETIFQCRR